LRTVLVRGRLLRLVAARIATPGQLSFLPALKKIIKKKSQK
jgi:hypothetical protein